MAKGKTFMYMYLSDYIVVDIAGSYCYIGPTDMALK